MEPLAGLSIIERNVILMALMKHESDLEIMKKFGVGGSEEEQGVTNRLMTRLNALKEG